MKLPVVVVLGLGLLLCGCSRESGEQPEVEPPAVETPSGLPDIEVVPQAESSAPSAPAAASRPKPDYDTFRQPELDDARIAALRSTADERPSDPDARRSLAHALYRAGRKQESIEHFEKALELDPGPTSLLDLGIAYSSVSRLGEAEATYRRLLALSPDNPKALHNLANIAVKRDDHDQAITYYRRAIEADPKYMLAYLHLADVLNSIGRHRNASAAYLTILDMTPSNPIEQGVYNDAVYRLASIALAQGDPGQAEELLSQLVQADPDHGAAHYARAQALLQLGREEEASREFEAHMQILSRRQPSSAAATEP